MLDRDLGLSRDDRLGLGDHLGLVECFSRDGLVECFGLDGHLGFGDRFSRDDLRFELVRDWRSGVLLTFVVIELGVEVLPGTESAEEAAGLGGTLRVA